MFNSRHKWRPMGKLSKHNSLLLGVGVDSDYGHQPFQSVLAFVLTPFNWRPVVIRHLLGIAPPTASVVRHHGGCLGWWRLPPYHSQRLRRCLADCTALAVRLPRAALYDNTTFIHHSGKAHNTKSYYHIKPYIASYIRERISNESDQKNGKMKGGFFERPLNVGTLKRCFFHNAADICIKPGALIMQLYR